MDIFSHSYVLKSTSFSETFWLVEFVRGNFPDQNAFFFFLPDVEFNAIQSPVFGLGKHILLLCNNTKAIGRELIVVQKYERKHKNGFVIKLTWFEIVIT